MANSKRTLLRTVFLVLALSLSNASDSLLQLPRARRHTEHYFSLPKSTLSFYHLQYIGLRFMILKGLEHKTTKTARSMSVPQTFSILKDLQLQLESHARKLSQHWLRAWNTPTSLPAWRRGKMSSRLPTMNLICSSCSSRERRTSWGEFSPCWLSSSTGDTIWRWGPLIFLFFPFLKRKIWLSCELPNQHKKMGLLSSYLCLQLVLVCSLLDIHMYLIPICAGCLLKEQICKWGGSFLPCQWKWNT